MRTPLWFPVALLAAAMLVSALMAHTVHAQIAAPRLNPVAGESATPINPAVLPWAHNSVIGAGYVDVTVEFEDTTGQTTEIAAGSGSVLLGRWVGETFALGAEVAQIEADINGGGTFEANTSWVGIGAQFAEAIGVGVGQQTEEEVAAGSPTFNDDTTESTLPMAGLSLRFAEVFYVGAAAGDETYSFDRPASTPATGEADRGVIRYGVAYAMRDGESGVHLEYYVQERDEINDAVSGISQPSEESDGITAEVVFANILINLERFNTDKIVESAGGVVAEVEETTASVGWAPLEGLSVVASVGSEEERDLANSQAYISDYVALAVGWGF